MALHFESAIHRPGSSLAAPKWRPPGRAVTIADKTIAIVIVDSFSLSVSEDFLPDESLSQIVFWKTIGGDRCDFFQPEKSFSNCKFSLPC